MFQFISNWLDRRTIRRSTVTDIQWLKAFSALPLLNKLTADEKTKLRKLAILFIDTKSFEGAHELVVTDHMVLIIALQACLPVLELGIGGYVGWTSVIVYPAGFAPERTVTDEYGVTHHVQSNLAGESWLRGPVVLSWDETERGGIIDGSNLVIHEFAHKLDMQNGVANGFPQLHPEMSSRLWAEALGAGFKDFVSKCSNGESKAMKIDCYGATSPAEYFAVLSEVFFERPELILEHYADVYEQLRQYYRQDTLTRLS
ncbi:MAG: zinc-dependent peptidase [Sulfuriflexus sp.]|nr:zinc-dependent peptidase [Sulfuriflexus sp.]